MLGRGAVHPRLHPPGKTGEPCPVERRIRGCLNKITSETFPLQSSLLIQAKNRTCSAYLPASNLAIAYVQEYACWSSSLTFLPAQPLVIQTGFTDPRVLEQSEVTVNDPELRDVLGEARFLSITYR